MSYKQTESRELVMDCIFNRPLAEVLKDEPGYDPYYFEGDDDSGYIIACEYYLGIADADEVVGFEGRLKPYLGDGSTLTLYGDDQNTCNLSVMSEHTLKGGKWVRTK